MKFADADRADIVLAALEHFEDACSRTEHRLCGGDARCRQVHRAEAAGREETRGFELYDVGLVTAEFRDALPGHGWPTTALMRVMRDAALTEPWLDEARRTATITLALARLGERGFPPDALLRTCMGSELRRNLLLTVAALWHATKTGELSLAKVPPHAQEWFPVLDVDEQLEHAAEMPFSDIAVATLTGTPGSEADGWLERAALAHLIAWRRVDALEVDLVPDELVLPPGRDATAWVFDRFTNTSLDDWERSSLEWELLWIHDPQGTAEQVSIASEVLRERPSSEIAVLLALRRRLTTPVGNDPLVRGLRSDEILGRISSMLGQGKNQGALTLARRAFEAAPQNPAIRMALVFCTVPTNPVEARRLIHQSPMRGGIQQVVGLANLVTSYLVEGDLRSAHLQCSGLAACCGENEAWLWEPETLISGGDPRVEFVQVRSWVERVRKLIAATT